MWRAQKEERIRLQFCYFPCPVEVTSVPCHGLGDCCLRVPLWSPQFSIFIQCLSVAKITGAV